MAGLDHRYSKGVKSATRDWPAAKENMVHEHLQRALACMAWRRFEAARDAALRVLAMEPENALAHLIVGESFLRTEEYAAGREQAARLIAIAPDWGWGYWLLAWCWLEDQSRFWGQANRLEKAAAAAHQALHCNPSEPSFYYLAASVELRRGDASTALQFAERGLAIAPQSQSLCRLRGQTLNLLGEQTVAQASLEQALELSPDDAPTHRLLAEVSYERGNYDRALEHVAEAMRLEPESSLGRDQYVEISQVKFRILRGLTWIYQATRTWRRWSIAWVAAVLIVGVPLNYWVESELLGHWSAGVILWGWMFAVVAPWMTLAIPLATNFVWLVAGRDPVRSSLSPQERWNRIFPAIAILFAPLAIVCAVAMQSMTAIEYYTTAIVVAQIQAAAAMFTSRRLRRLTYAAAGGYALLVAALLIEQAAGSLVMANPALVLNMIALIFTTVFRLAQYSLRRR